MSGAVSLKALAFKALERDTQRDTARDNPHSNVSPTSETGALPGNVIVLAELRAAMEARRHALAGIMDDPDVLADREAVLAVDK